MCCSVELQLAITRLLALQLWCHDCRQLDMHGHHVVLVIQWTLFEASKARSLLHNVATLNKPC